MAHVLERFDDPVRVLEIISPGGFEQLFRELSALGEPTPEAISELGARYGVDVDLDATCRSWSGMA